MSRHSRWTPPRRPDWVARVNEEGSYMDLRGVVPLNAESLIDAAKQNTGLSDFGDDCWREPFEIIVRALDEEANLNLVGRLMCRSDLLIFLEGRLNIEDTYKRHPEIENEEIVKPLFIVGQGRTGTSALLNLLESDPNNKAIQTWEAMFPCPPPEKSTYDDDSRIEKADKLVTQWNRIVPEIEAVHEFAGRIPAECVQVMAFGFITIWFNLMGQIPSYSQYMKRADWRSAYEYHKRILKLLQWKNPRRNWVLKATEHLRFMPIIREVYPDACFIWPHRDPVVAVSSSSNLTGYLNWMRSDEPKISGFENYNHTELASLMLEQPIEWLEQGVIDRKSLCNILYNDFLENPLSVIKKIYDQFDINANQEDLAAIETYIAANPRSARPSHKYDLGTEQEISRDRILFEKYQVYFDVPSEI